MPFGSWPPIQRSGVRTCRTRQDIERHIVSLLARYSDSYASNQFRALQRFYAWLSDEEQIANPMAGMTGPSIGDKTVPVLSDDDMRKLLKACAGRSWRQRRDVAIICMFRDTGCRLAELVGLTVDNVDLQAREAIVTGKGNRERWVKFGTETALAVDRYLRVRPVPETGTPLFGMLSNGIYQAVKRRAAQAGVDVHPHQFRHGFAHHWLDHGGAEGDLMQLSRLAVRSDAPQVRRQRGQRMGPPVIRPGHGRVT